MKRHLVLISTFLLMTLPVSGVAAEAEIQPGAGDQRAACDAQCRENYQNNSTAMQACLRDCGAIGPASPAGAMAPTHEAAHTVQQTTTVKGSKSNSDNIQTTKVKGIKSNSSERQTNPGSPPPVPAEASNLNLSKSNINREAPPPDAGIPPAEASKVKSSKSNSSDRQAAPDTSEEPPAEQEGAPPADG